MTTTRPIVSDPALLKRVAAGKSLVVVPVETNVAPAEIVRAAVQSYGLPTYPGDGLLMFLVALPVALSVASSEVDPALGVVLLVALALGSIGIFMVLVPLVRRLSARALLAQVDLADAIVVSLPHSDVTIEAGTFHPQWGRESKVRARHLSSMWALAVESQTRS